MSLTIGIDPGITGAWALLDSDGNYCAAGDLPVIRDGKLGWIDAESLVHDLQWITSGKPTKATVERVHAMPGNGSQAAFSQGATLGSLLAALQVLRFPVSLVTPNSWKKAMGLGKDKSASLDKARMLYPAASLDRKKDHNRAEALLIARYAQARTCSSSPT